MFWKYNTLAVSHIDTLLDKQTVTLAEILEQEDIIQECKSQNKKLVDFLTKQEILAINFQAEEHLLIPLVWTTASFLSSLW